MQNLPCTYFSSLPAARQGVCRHLPTTPITGCALDADAAKGTDDTEYAAGSIPHIAYRPLRPSGGGAHRSSANTVRRSICRIPQLESHITTHENPTKTHNGNCCRWRRNRRLRAHPVEDRERDLRHAGGPMGTTRDTISDTGAGARPTCRRRPTRRPSPRRPPATRAEPPGGPSWTGLAAVPVTGVPRPMPPEQLKTSPANIDGTVNRQCTSHDGDGCPADPVLQRDGPKML